MNRFLNRALKFSILALFFSTFNVEAQDLNQYKYFVVQNTTNSNSKKILLRELSKANLPVYDANSRLPSDLQSDPSLGVYINSAEECPWTCNALLVLSTYQGVIIYQNGSTSPISSGNALKAALKPLLQVRHSYKPIDLVDVGLSVKFPQINFSDEESIRKYYDENGAELIEGIWEYSAIDDPNYYRLAILKDKTEFKAVILDTEENSPWKAGELKASLETATTDEILSIEWTMGDKRTKKRAVGLVTKNALIEFELETKVNLLKIYPKSATQSSTGANSITSESSDWLGNGSGVLISKSGLIVTNYHVIEDTNELEVDINQGGETSSYKAQVLLKDKVNDLAIVQLTESNSLNISSIPFSINRSLSDVGTKIYAYGYPMALTAMGKELKVTDGMINSKTGFDGDITTYQISAPIQGGNSGGPLFDDKGNLIGINTAGLKKTIADNVGYSVKANYIFNLLSLISEEVEFPQKSAVESLPLTEQIKELSKYVVLIKFK